MLQAMRRKQLASTNRALSRWLRSHHDDLRRLNEQHPQIPAAALRDTPEDRFTTPAVLPRDKLNPWSQVTFTLKGLPPPVFMTITVRIFEPTPDTITKLTPFHSGRLIFPISADIFPIRPSIRLQSRCYFLGATTFVAPVGCDACAVFCRSLSVRECSGRAFLVFAASFAIVRASGFGMTCTEVR
ncbi:MAG: hypothetical protein AAF376_02325 [Pseudomonadota bacterium]